MLPLAIAGTGALLGGIGGYLSNRDRNKSTGAAITGAQNIADTGAATQRGLLNQFSADNRLDYANKLNQDANAYEQRQAVQGALAAYGGSPLMGSGKANALANLAQQARGNYQTALQNANQMLGSDLQNNLGVEQGILQNNMDIQNSRMAQAAGQQSGLGSALSGLGSGLSIGTQAANTYKKLKGMG